MKNWSTWKVFIKTNIDMVAQIFLSPMVYNFIKIFELPSVLPFYVEVPFDKKTTPSKLYELIPL